MSQRYSNPNQPNQSNQPNYYQNNPNYNNGYNNYNGGPGYPPNNQPPCGPQKKNKKKKSKKRRIIFFIIELILLLIVAAALYVAVKFSKLNTESLDLGQIIINEGITKQDGSSKLSGYKNIALFGVDSRTGNLESGTNSDTIMVASINNDTKEIKLVSVYRDTYLDTTLGYYTKATETYGAGGAQASVNMLNKNLDLDITDYVTVDFNAVAAAVDAVGGIDLTIEEDEVVFLNDYLVETSQVLGIDYYEDIPGPGTYHVDGLHALAYCRIRYTAGNDFKRTERQRTVLLKLLDAAKSAGILQLNSLIDELFPMVSTSLSAGEIFNLAKSCFSYSLGETSGFPFEVANYNSDKSYVVAVDLAANVSQLHSFLFNDTDYTPSATVQQISNEIAYTTGY
ncbi:MAG: LCP family protein [Robinsoniella sp.]|nr:LCP family protein [Robinsoniella sp.]